VQTRSSLARSNLIELMTLTATAAHRCGNWLLRLCGLTLISFGEVNWGCSWIEGFLSTALFFLESMSLLDLLGG